jgi:hypothetical protein
MQVIEVLNEEATQSFLDHPMLEWRKVIDPNKDMKKGWQKTVYCEDERLSLRTFGQEIPVLVVPKDLPSISLEQMEEIPCVAANLCGFVSLAEDADFKKAHQGKAAKKDLWEWTQKVKASEPQVLILLDKVVRPRSNSV